jgi:hypothetical protein
MIILFFRLSNLCEKTRKQSLEIEHEYERFRLKQFATHFFPKQFNSPVQTPVISTPKLRRSHSFYLNSPSNSSSLLDSSTTSNIFDISTASVYKTHLTELKSRINSLTSECSLLNDKLHQSEHDKRYLIDRITCLERQRRDDNDSFQNELNLCKKLLEKSSYESSNSISSNIHSPP